MTCEDTRKMLQVRLKWWPTDPRPVIAHLLKERRILVAKVRWGDRGGRKSNYFWDCGSWTFDVETFQEWRRGFDIMHWHLREPQEANQPAMIFTIAADTFLRSGHSSFTCDDKARQRQEKWHCPLESWQYDRALLQRYPQPSSVKQGALL